MTMTTHKGPANDAMEQHHQHHKEPVPLVIKRVGVTGANRTKSCETFTTATTATATATETPTTTTATADAPAGPPATPTTTTATAKQASGAGGVTSDTPASSKSKLRPSILNYDGTSDVSCLTDEGEEADYDNENEINIDINNHIGGDSVRAVAGSSGLGGRDVCGYGKEQPLETVMEAAIEEGRRVIQAEADCLNVLAAGLSATDLSATPKHKNNGGDDDDDDDDGASSASATSASFGRVVELMSRAIGRIVITGVGKSGIIGQKIAATLSSTGTPSLFVHAGDAAHGDLGMISSTSNSDDVVLAISKSGESAELAAIIQFCQRFEVPLVAMTQKPLSTLGRAAKYHLLLPNVPEACHLKVAPTTSSTATLALGDALAVALSRVRGFSLHEFGSLHPGGNLGRLSMRIDTIMHKNLPLCSQQTTVAQALVIMATHRRGCVGIVEPSSSSSPSERGEKYQQQQHLVGIVTDRELQQEGSLLDMNACVTTIMSSCVITADPRSSAQEVLHNMNGHENVDVMFVTHPRTNEPIGVVHRQDLLGAN